MPIRQVVDDKIDFLETLFKENPGKHQLHFTIYERADKIKVQMPSRTHKIDISAALLEALDKEQVKYKLN